jgi:hypothetical protein
MTKRNKYFSIFIILTDIIMLILFPNIKYFLYYYEKYPFLDIIIGGILIISILINTIILIIIRNKIYIIYFIDLFLLHIIFIWASIIIFIFKYKIYSIRVFIIPIIILIIYIVFSIIIKRKGVKRQNDT